MQARLLTILCLLFLAGCAGPSHTVREPRPAANLEPEITELDALRNSRGRPLTPAERQALDSKIGIAFKLSAEETREVQLFFQSYTRDKHETVQRWLMRSEPHLEYVRAVLASHRLPQDLLALPYIESGYNVLAVSSAGAVGMWQFMPATARRFGLTVDWWLDERRDPYLATVAAARYLKILHQQFGDWQLALAAYNAGEGAISRAMTSSGTQTFNTLAKSSAPIKEETRHYVPRFLAMVKIAQNARKLGFKAPDMRVAKDLEEVRIPAATDLAGLASHLGLSWEQFHAINPAYRRQVSPPDRSTAAWVPKKLAHSAMAWVDSPRNAAGGASRLAKGGDTWWSLSRETGIAANTLREANKGHDRPIPGRGVLIPLAACALDGGSQALEAAPSRQAAAPGKASPQPAVQPALYIVRKGDTLESVAAKTGVGVQDLIAMNKADPRHALTPGTPLLIPAKSSPAPAQEQAAAPAKARAQAPATAQAQVSATSQMQAQADKPAERTELNPAPRYKILRRPGT